MAYSTDKLALVTGAGSGIGRALALQFNREGCRLLLCDVNEQALQDTVDALERKDIAHQTKLLDVADRAGFHAWAEQVAAEHGKLDILINNAGVALIATVAESKYEDLDWLMGINFWGVVHGTMAFLPLIQKAEQGHIVNVSSVFGLFAVPTQSAYNAAKFAVRGYTEALRQEMAGSSVSVCCVHPGGIKTNIVRDSRSSDPGADKEERSAQFHQVARTSPASAATQIILAIEKRKKRLLIGTDAKILSLITRLFPVSYNRFIPGLDKLETS